MERVKLERAELKIGAHKVEVRAKLIGDDIPDWDKKSWKHYHFKIYLKTNYGQRSFDYWTSAKDHEEGRAYLSEENLIYATRCVLEDALSGSDNFEEDTDSREAEKTFKACERTFYKVDAIGLKMEDIRNTINTMED